MKLEQQGDEARIILTRDELYLMRRALERASYMDTPPSEQQEILSFCAQALDILPEASRTGRH